MGLQDFFNTKLARVFQRNGKQLPKCIAIALSGGVDSMALTHLAHRFSQQNDIQLFPITINHNLRPTSTLEIPLIRQQLDKMGLLRNYHTMDIHLERASLTQSSTDAKEIEEEARVKRYAALTEVCSSLGVRDVLLGHHLDDQIETYCIRLLKNSGIFGLAGMQELSKAPVNIKPERLQLVRPLLDVRKSQLYEHCIANDIEWVQDYTNFDEEYGIRNVVRKYLKDNEAVQDRMLSGYTAAMKFNHRTDLKIKKLYTSIKEDIQQDGGNISMKIPTKMLEKYSDIVLAKFLFKMLYPLSPSRNYHYSFNKILEIVPRLTEESTSNFTLLQLQWTSKTVDDHLIIEICRQNPSSPITYSFIMTPYSTTDDFLFDNTYWFKLENTTSEYKHYTIKTLTQQDKQLMETPPKDYKYSRYKNTPALVDDDIGQIVALPVFHKEDYIACKLKDNIYSI